MEQKRSETLPMKKFTRWCVAGYYYDLRATQRHPSYGTCKFHGDLLFYDVGGLVRTTMVAPCGYRRSEERELSICVLCI